MEIVYRDLSIIKPNPDNPRKAKAHGIEDLAESIKINPDYFEARPILLSDRTGELVIVGGERRSEAARYLGMEKVPTILLSGLTEERERELMIIDNTHSGVWDEKMLESWDKSQLQKWGVELPKWDKVTKEVKDDNFDTDGEISVKCKRGDIWQLGEHRLMCGDSVNLEDVKKLMGGGCADIAFASPPYNAGFGANLTKDNGRSKYMEGDDNKSAGEYAEFLMKYTECAMAASKYNFVNIQMLANNKDALFAWLQDKQQYLADIVIWDKGRSQPQLAANVLNSEFEFVFIFSEKANRAIGTMPFHGTLKNIIHITPGHNDYSKIHNAVFPIELPAYFVENFAKDSVLDLFGGTGTTLIACEQLGRKCYTMEIDPHYCDVIIERWKKHTGKQAVKI